MIYLIEKYLDMWIALIEAREKIQAARQAARNKRMARSVAAKKDRHVNRRVKITRITEKLDVID